MFTDIALFLFPRWMARRKVDRAIRERAAYLFLNERLERGDSNVLLASYAETLGIDWRLNRLEPKGD